MADTEVRQWTCEGNVPGCFGSLNVGLPLLVVEVAGAWHTVRVYGTRPLTGHA